MTERHLRAARRRRALLRKEAVKRAQAVKERLADVVTNARAALADAGFRSLLRSHGTTSFPAPLLKAKRSKKADSVGHQKRANEVSLDFLIAWSFFFPLFANREIVTFLKTNRPGFIEAMKDAFIAIVIEGPFPHVLSGHRGARHGGRTLPDC